MIVMKQILCDPCSLCFPVAPDTHCTMMKMIPSYRHIDRCMQLDTCHFRTCKLLHIVDMMDMVVLDHGENTAHSADNTCLFTMMDMTSADNMPSYGFFRPSVILSSADCISFHLRCTLYMLIGEIMIIFRIVIFSKGNTAAFTVTDLTVLDDPSFCPVRSDHTILISCRRCPCGSCFIDIKSTDCNIIYMVFRWHKAVAADIDLHLFHTGIFSLKIRINNCFLSILFCIPFVYGPFRFPGMYINLTFDTLL